MRRAHEPVHGAILLAAGASTRLGRAKQLIEVEGEPLLRIDAPAGKLTTNLAFAPGKAEIFVIESATASILRADVAGEGQAMFSHA